MHRETKVRSLLSPGSQTVNQNGKGERTYFDIESDSESRTTHVWVCLTHTLQDPLFNLTGVSVPSCTQNVPRNREADQKYTAMAKARLSKAGMYIDAPGLKVAL